MPVSRRVFLGAVPIALAAQNAFPKNWNVRHEGFPPAAAL
jgi:hypothetical protein